MVRTMNVAAPAASSIGESPSPTTIPDPAPSAVAIDDLPLPYIEMDSRGVIVRANRATLALHPKDHGELIGRLAWDLMAPDEKEPSCAAYLSFMQSGEGAPVVRRSLYTRQGQFRVCDLYRSLVRDPEGHPAGIRMLFVDVTQADQLLEDSRRRLHWLECIYESAPDAVLIADPLGFICMANPAAEKLLGRKALDLIGKPIEEGLSFFSYGTGRTRSDFTTALNQPSKGIAVLLDPKKNKLRVEITTSPIVHKETGFASGVITVLRKMRAPGKRVI